MGFKEYLGKMERDEKFNEEDEYLRVLKNTVDYLLYVS